MASVGLFYGGKEKAKSSLGGINDNAPNSGLSKVKKITLNTVGLVDLITSPVHPLLKASLLEEEMLIVFKK